MWGETYEKYSGTITEGDYIIVYDGGAMKSSVSSSRLDYSTVTISNDAISNPDASIVWHIAPSGNYWTIYNANSSNYAAGNGTKNQAALITSSTDYSLWSVTGTSTYEFVNKGNKAKSVNANLRRNGNYGFACYSTSTGGALTLYKKVEDVATKTLSSIAVSGEKTEYTVGDSFVMPTVTATYSDASIANVTASATCSGYDMSTAGNQTVTVSYTENSVTKTTTYSITVSAEQGGGDDSGDGEWVETEIANISSTDIVVVTMTKSSVTYALTSANGASAAPTAVVVTVKDNKLANEPDDNLKWNIASSSGNLIIYPNGTTSKWLYSTTSNNGIRVGTGENKTFVIDGTYGYLQQTNTSRYVGVYNNADWRSYTSMHDNIKGQTLKFYKKTVNTPTTYTVTYDANGATSGSVPADANSPYTENTSVTVLGNTGSLAKTGYTFNGWNTQADGQGISYSAGGTFTITKYIILYAQWTANTYTVTFDNQEATTEGAASITATYDEAMPSIASNLPKKTGYAFQGYFTATSGGIQYYKADGTSAKKWDKTSGATLYAQWTPITYKITYTNLKGATNGNQETYTIEDAITFSAPTNLPKGYDFTGWNPASITVGTTGDKTVEAQWTPTTYTITYDNLGGASNTNPTQYTIESEAINFVDPGTRDGYIFKGWEPASLAKGSIGNQIVTAKWCEILGDATGLSVQTDYVENGLTYVKFSWTPADNTKSHAFKQVICIGKVGEEKKCTDLEKNINWTGDLRSKLSPGEYEWTIQAIGDGTDYCDGEVIAGANFTIIGYVISFDPDGGDGDYNDVTIFEGETFTLPAAPTKANYTFKAWSDGTNLYQPGDEISNLTEDLTLTAIWRLTTSLSWSEPTCTATIASPSNEFPELTTTPADLQGVQYSSSEPTVATIDESGNIVLKSAGTTTIRAYYEEDATYAASEASYTLTVVASTNCKWIETDIEDIDSGDEVVVTMTKENFAWTISNEKNTSAAPTAIDISANVDGKYLTGVQDGYKWIIEKDDANLIFYSYNDNSNYLYCINQDNGVRVGTGDAKVFVVDGNYLKNTQTTNPRYLGISLNTDPYSWRCYTLNTAVITNQTLKFYKKTCLPLNTFWVDYELANVVCANTPPHSQIANDSEDLLLEFVANDGYKLPESISVSIGNNVLPADNDVYIWDNESGELLIVAAEVTDNIIISISGCERLQAPANLLCSKVTSTSATLSWESVANADSYTVYVTDGTNDITQSTNENTITITGLIPNTLYTWDVIATAADYCENEHSQEWIEFTTLDQFTVTFNANGHGTAPAAQTIDDGGYAQSPNDDPEDNGYSFEGWYDNENCEGDVFDFENTAITKNTTLYAKWNIVTYNITYAGLEGAANNANNPTTYTIETSTITFLAPSTRDGYIFSGWNPETLAKGSYGNQTITANWEKGKVVIWKADNEEILSKTYKSGDKLVLPTQEIEACQGSAFVGWTAIENYSHATDAPAYVTASSTVTTDATYYAVYANVDGKSEEVTMQYGGGSTTNMTGENDAATIGLDASEWSVIASKGNSNNYPGLNQEGTIRLYYNASGSNYITITSSTKTINNIEITYKKSNNKGLVIVDGNTISGEEIANDNTIQTVRYNINANEFVIKNGYTSSTQVHITKVLIQTGSTSYSNYSTSCSSIYNISYDLNGGEKGCTDESVTAGGDYTICDDEPTKTGYTFHGWNDGTTTHAAGTTILNVQSNITLTAVWEANEYTITWMSNGEEQGTTTHTYNQPLQVADAPYNCYGAKTFIGWTEANEVSEDGEGIEYITSSTNPSEDKTYYAVFADATSNGSGGYDKVTEALDDYSGEYLIVYESGKKALNGGLSTLDAVSNGINVTITNNTIESNSTTDAARFTIASITSGYSIKSASGKYIGRTENDNDLEESTTTIYTNTISINNDKSINIIGSGGAYLRYNTDGSRFRYFKSSTYTNQQAVALYKKTVGATFTNFTTTPTGCPEIEVAENAYVTSANGQSVKVNIPVTVNFQDGYTIEVSIGDGTNFDLVSVSEITDNKATVTLAYKPDYSNDTENTTVTLTAKYGENFVTAKSFTLNGRSLPETFAVVAKVGNMWYALPEVEYEAGKHATAYPVEVDNASDPTEVTSAIANNAAWSLRQVYEAQKSNAQHDRYATSGTNFVLENKQTPAKLLNASAPSDKGSNNYLLTSAQYDNYYGTNPGLYEWTPTTTDLVTYTLTNVQRTDKQINISTHAAFGLHASDIVTSELRFLPIQGTYTTLTTQVVEWKENSVVIMYNGDPTQTAQLLINGSSVGSATLSAVQKDIAVYELPATGLAANPGQMLKIAIGSEQMLLSIPYIISESKVDKNILPGSNVAGRQEVAKVSDLVILKGGILTADGAKTNSYKFRNVTVYGGGKLVVPADKGFGVNTLTFRIGGVTPEGNYDYVYPEFELNINYDKAFTNTSAVINLDYVTTKSQYYTFVAPFAVNTKDIKYPVDIYGNNVAANNRGSFEFQYYDGAARANGEKGWKVVEEDPTNGATLTAHQGYTFYGMPKKVSVNGGTSTRQKFGIHRIPMSVTAANVMSHENTGQTTAVSAYLSEHNINAGWNLIGNPYMATITGLNSNSIQTGTIVLVDNKWQWSDAGSQANRFIVFPSNDGEWYYTSQASNATLPAFKNFFVQIANESATALSIPRNTPQAQLLAPARQAEEIERDIELAIVLEKDEAHSDQMDFLLNDTYGAGFDHNADFTKMMNNTNLNLYGVHWDDKLSFVAIDHFTARAAVEIGYQVPSAGEYTLRISDKPYVMLDKIEALYVTDHEMNPAVTTNLMEEDYVFQVGKAEINDTRFTISFGAPTNNNGGDVTTDMGEVEVNSEQPQKFFYDGKLYILREGKVYSATGHEIKTINK